MTGRKIMSIIGLGLDAFLILFLFLPFAKGGYDTLNFWDFMKQTLCQEMAIILLIEIIVSIIMLTLQICGVLKDSKLATFPFAFIFTFCLGLFLLAMNKDVLSQLQFGFYFNLILSTAGIIVLGIGGLLSNEKKNAGLKPVGFDPQTGKPIYEAPKKIAGYDPQTGKPIYE